MLDLDITLLFQLGNFFVAVFLLNLLLIRPIRQVLKKRKQMVEGLQGEAETFESRAEKKLADYELALQAARQEATTIRQTGRESGLAEQHDLVSKAQNEARSLLEEARATLQKEADATLATLRGEVAMLSKQVADRLTHS